MNSIEILPDIPRYLTAHAEWLAVVLYAYLIHAKFSWKWLGKAFLLGLVQLMLQLIAGELPLVFWIPGMLVNIIWMGLSIRLLSHVSLYPGIFVLSKAFMLSELLASTVWLIYCLFFLGNVSTALWVEIFFNLSLYAGIGAFIYYVERKGEIGEVLASFTWKDTLTSILVVALTFAMSNMGFLLSETSYNLGNSLAVFVLRTFVNITGLLLLYIQQYLRKDQFQRTEVDNIRHLFNSQYRQYKSFAESTAYINRKSHDLKHQMSVILSESDVNKREEYLTNLKSSIENLEAKIETGNAVLDTFLTQKNQYCITNDINFTCIANGDLLNHLQVTDLVSLLGNALDNAIEHVEKYDDPEKRLITLKLTSKANMVVLRIDNYLMTELEAFDDLPETSKQDKIYHGYGLKSIRYIANRYGGYMNINTEDYWFSLQVVFPMNN
ncbi:GHKL domain-containing protein [Aerococcaceae bacterium DSM 111021]|nr:GHKL domain-containing protein [Aerococcaceae bacterium DSM 111021]